MGKPSSLTKGKASHEPVTEPTGGRVTKSKASSSSNDLTLLLHLKDKNKVAALEAIANNLSPAITLERYKRPGKSSRVSPSQYANRIPVILKYKDVNHVATYTKVIVKFTPESDIAARPSVKVYIKSTIEDCISATMRAVVYAYRHPTPVISAKEIEGFSRHPISEFSDVDKHTNDVYNGTEALIHEENLNNLVQHLEAVTCTTCPRPAVMGDFLLDQRDVDTWTTFVNSGFVTATLAEEVNDFGLEVQLQAEFDGRL